MVLEHRRHTNSLHVETQGEEVQGPLTPRSLILPGS